MKQPLYSNLKYDHYLKLFRSTHSFYQECLFLAKSKLKQFTRLRYSMASCIQTKNLTIKINNWPLTMTWQQNINCDLKIIQFGLAKRCKFWDRYFITNFSTESTVIKFTNRVIAATTERSIFDFAFPQRIRIAQTSIFLNWQNESRSRRQARGHTKHAEDVCGTGRYYELFWCCIIITMNFL